jgi:hypothetical protein
MEVISTAFHLSKGDKFNVFAKRDISLTNYFHDFNQILIWQGFDGIIFAFTQVLTPFLESGRAVHGGI